MGPVVTMGHVYAMTITMEVTAHVNQYFLLSYCKLFENVILLNSKFEVDVTASILFYL